MMMIELIEAIKKDIDVRKNLIQVKELLKSAENCCAFKECLAEPEAFFKQLLEHEDAKVRKNTVSIMGKLGDQTLLSLIFAAYKKETQLFVRSAYLTAIGELNYFPLLDDLKRELEKIKKISLDENNKKHIEDERKILQQLILAVEGIHKHKFTGNDKNSEIILLTNRNYREITLEKVKENPVKSAELFNAGVILKGGNIKKLQEIRTYKELLFCLPDLKVCERDALSAAKAIASGSLYTFLKERHEGDGTYYFRIEYKGKSDIAQRSIFTKKLANELETLSKGKLVNSVSNYEFEIRLIENKQGKLNLLIKLYTLEDYRFSYRFHSIASSIQPVNAALFMELCKSYLKEQAKVLDPFCGVGTMLIERHKSKRANTLYGIDTYEDAVAGARKNTERAGMTAHYIHKNFFDFTHEYLFDEIITNFPRITQNKNKKEIEETYRKFFQKAKSHLYEDGIIVLHTYDAELVKKYKGQSYKLLQEFEISKKENSTLFVLCAN